MKRLTKTQLIKRLNAISQNQENEFLTKAYKQAMENQMRDPLQETLDLILSGYPALSIRQPWVWAILNMGKDIENRSRKTNYRGKILLHASLTCTQHEYDVGINQIGMCSGISIPPPSLKDMERGGIVGVADLVACVTESESPWFFGDYGYVLKNVKPLPFVSCKGMLGIFTPKLTA